MIGYWEQNGKLIIHLQRCNDFGDHRSGKLKGRDGDIIINCERLGGHDHHDTKILIDAIAQRLKTNAGTDKPETKPDEPTPLQ